MKLKNPVLPGCYPDPSICRKGNDFYMVTSSFEYFPGIPVFHSRDMVHWHQIGHCLTRVSQLNLDGIKPSKGIYAATIRYREADDMFYVVTTLVQEPQYWGNCNFYVCAKDPAGPWSEPVVIEGAQGIDPTLFFEGGRTWYLGNMRPYPDQPELEDRHIWLQELDLEKGKLIGSRYILREDGAVHNAVAPEGPHLYKVCGWYYLMIAEGGTDHNHSVTVFRSREITGPYEVNPRNPLITHRNLRRDYPINSTGHADLIQLQNGEWWAVLLASRPDGGDYRNLGRETFAVPVIWEEDWPVFSPDTGRVEFSFPAPELPECRWPDVPCCDHFEGRELGYEWNFIRTPRQRIYSLNDRPGFLRLYLGAAQISELKSCSFIGRRQQHMCFAARTVMEFEPHVGEACGMVMLMNNQYYISMLMEITDGCMVISVYRCFAGAEELMGRISYTGKRVWMKITAYEQDYSFWVAAEAEKWIPVAEHIDGTLLSKEVAGGFTGAYVGLYGTARGQETANFADYDWFEYGQIAL